MTPDNGRAAAGASMAAPTKMHYGAEAHESYSRLGQADDQHDHANQSDSRAPRKTAPGRDVRLGLAVAEGGHRRDADGSAGRPDRGYDGHADAYRQGHEYCAGLEDERPGR